MSIIYFITAIYGDRGFVKIGITRSKNTLQTRISNIKTSNPRDVKLLGYLMAEDEEEVNLHLKFGHLHVRGEWFKLDKEITDYIRLNGQS